MELSILLIKEIAVLMLIMSFGWLAVRFKLLKVEDSKALSIVTLYIICPCVIIRSFQIQFDFVKLQGFGLAVLGALIAQFFMVIVSRLLRSPLKLDPIEEGSLGYPNAGIVIIPIVMATMGEEWIFYSTAYIALQTIMLWTHARTLICGDGWNLKKIIRNINVIAIILGLVLFICDIKLPNIVNESLHYVGGMIGPMGMLIIGMLLAGINLKDIFTSKRAYFITFLRMIMLPAALVLILVITKIANLHTSGVQILTITVLAAAAPPASTITQFAQIYGRDAKYASVLNMLGVIVCIVTMPLIVFFYRYLQL